MLTPYTGPWTFETAAHLLRRTIFGPTKARIEQAVDEGLDNTIASLMGPTPEVDPPIYYDFSADPTAEIGETWTDKVLDGNITGIYFAREKTLWAWWFMQMNRNQTTIHEKLTLFWHNHFVVSEAGHANMQWDYLSLLREYALGDFRELTKRITIDRSMLIYLNGTSNYVTEPNENYARELLELFTIGKGNLVAPGDYTNYTEQDIAAIARALTGWTAWTPGNEPAAFEYWWSSHDSSTKQLSHRFDNQVITNAGADEYKNVIDIIFQKDEVARHICRRLYSWFVHYNINDTIEAEVIEPMAQILIDNDYIIQPTLEALLRSEHFFSSEVRGCMIKSPLDCFYSAYNTFDVAPADDLLVEYNIWVAWYWQFLDLEMGVFKHPSVAGWKAYYQGPQYYRNWINSASLTLRRRMLRDIKWLIQYISPETKGYDFLTFIESLDNPMEPNDLIDEVCQLIYPRPLTSEQKDFFKAALIPGLPDFEWTVEYSDYLSDPDNEAKRLSVENKLFSMFTAMMNVPEFQLS
jgi:hypothetical protein